MKKLFYFLPLFIVLLSMQNTSCAQDTYLKKWPRAFDPAIVGKLVAEHFADSPHTNFGSHTVPGSITYPEVCAWYGALKFAESSKDKQLVKRLTERFEPLFGEEKKLVPPPVHVDNTVFGAIPLELFKLTKEQKYLDLGKSFADKQWELPGDLKGKAVLKNWDEKGYSWQTRLWIDDMFMITMIQTQAFRETGDRAYINRAAKEMKLYLDSLQQPNGLFYHATDAPFFWGRGNGWMAAGMAELLSSLPEKQENYAFILHAYKTMMHNLKKYQDNNGMWHQLVDDSNAWAETSCTGMFVYAIITGVKKGWLDKNEFGPVARKGWMALVAHIDKKGEVRDVCEGTNKKNSHQYYLDRKRLTGDLHGQAPILWCASAFLSKE
jgi:unsaturated rhamnogalacturonyl hydrolase